MKQRKQRPFSLRHLWHKHGHEMLWAVALTLVGAGALAYSMFSAG